MYKEWELETALPEWHRRGEIKEGNEGLSEEDAKKVIRASVEDGMNGFFVACFKRKVKN